jgi:hypothetical protein
VPSDSGSRDDLIAPDPAGKVIVLRDHQAAERLLDDLLAADPDSLHFHSLLDDVPAAGPPVIAAVVRRLDGFNPAVVDVLARVVGSYPDAHEFARHLRRVATDRRSADRRRMGAIMVLEQALDVQPPDDFLSTLKEPVRAATGMLLGALDAHSRSPAALHDYLRALVAQPVDLLYSVLTMLSQIRDDRAIEVLRLLAMHPDADLQHSAIETLANVGSPQALLTLHTLEWTLGDDGSRAVGRQLQKLRLSGVDTGGLQKPNDECRAWLGPIDGRGDRLMWLAAPGMGTGRCVMWLVLNDTAGLLEAAGSPHAAPAALPPAAEVGTLHSHNDAYASHAAHAAYWPADAGIMLEAPYTYAMRLLHEAARLNWATGNALPTEYQLLNPAYWAYGAYVETCDPAEYGPAHTPAGTHPDSESDLLFDPLFDTWYLDSPGVTDVAREVATLDTGLTQELGTDNWRMLLPALIRLAHDEFGPQLRARYAARLRRMAEWLMIAGNPGEARMAQSCARTMEHSPPETNLFVIRLVQKGILVALSQEGG